MAKSKNLKAEKSPKKETEAMLKQLDGIIKYYCLAEEDTNSTLIIHKLMETLEVYLKTIQQILQPEEFHALHEASAFNEAEKADLFKIYKKIIIMHRELLKALIMNNEKNSIKTIKEIHDKSLELTPKMLTMVEKLQKSWNDDGAKTRNSSLHYVG